MKCLTACCILELQKFIENQRFTAQNSACFTEMDADMIEGNFECLLTLISYGLTFLTRKPLGGVVLGVGNLDQENPGT